ncbi:MAG: adenosylcobalamin-dependent ribonucleoside-diphosphate reductase [Pseudomonadota bacterium]|nr:adenosylcobalamin-dependent ribonucleoside-diphosphate reductase [Pseudomonadota bacterium]
MVDDNALLVLKKRYLIKDVRGNAVETPDQMFERVVGFVAGAEEMYGDKGREEIGYDFFHMLRNLEFLPNSPTLMNAGRELGQLAACFVLPIEDSLDSIFDQVKMTAKIHQSGGGTGFSFSKLRPKDDVVASTMGVASGPVSFMTVFNMVTDVIKQGGTRRGANMGILRIDHPDIEEFITIKNNPEAMNNFNLSVSVTDEFMAAYEKGIRFPLINPRTKEETKTVDPRELIQMIAQSAWKSGEPGMIFIDTINRENPTPHIGAIEATNPCGEQPLLPYESCCLGSINLAKLVKNGEIDWRRLRELTHLGVRFLDNLIDINRYPAPQIEDISRRNRKIGLGVMGFAHLLIKLGIAYDSFDAVKTAEEIMAFIQAESKVASNLLAKQRGVFPSYKGSVWEARGLRQRNATTTTIAPTGTLSLIAGTSGGIEPIYDVRYSRVLFGNIKVDIVDPLYRNAREKDNNEEQMKKIFRRAHDVAPSDHLAIQSAFQKHVDNAVSKTINLPQDATIDTVVDVYLRAHRMGLKGVTIFRDKSRDAQVLSCGTQQAC